MKIPFIASMVVILAVAMSPVAGAQGQGGYGGAFCPYCGSYLGPGGGQYGMGPGMMGGYGYGYGYGPGGRHMRGPGYQGEACRKFLDDTAPLRKDLNSKRYEYFEALRNPKTDPETARKLERELFDLQEKIYAKNTMGCWW